MAKPETIESILADEATELSKSYESVLEDFSAPIPDNFFFQIKRQNEETEQLNERIRKQKAPNRLQ